MNVHIGVAADSGLVHPFRDTCGHGLNITKANTLLHRQESVAFADAGYEGVEMSPDGRTSVTWPKTMRPGVRKALNSKKSFDAIINQIEKCNASILVREHPFRLIKRQLGIMKVRYIGLKKNTAQLIPLFALSNLWIVRRQLMGVQV